MTLYLFDSSALVKRYVTENGSSWVRSTITPEHGNTIFIAQITPVEVLSALMRRKREGTIIDPRLARAARLYLDRHVAHEYHIISFTDTISQLAEDLLENHRLRAADAIQLASAIDINRLLISAQTAALIFVSSDQRLIEVANMMNIVTKNPESYA